MPRGGSNGVQIGKQTELRTTGGETVPLDGLHMGIPVAVFGHPGTEGRSPVADVVLILER